jgi:hypothetical protein
MPRSELHVRVAAAGLLNAAIARVRSTSIRTVASQGARQKAIEIEAGLATSAVSKSLHAARRRLGNESICERTPAFGAV